jgi:hypothetical protein
MCPFPVWKCVGGKSGGEESEILFEACYVFFGAVKMQKNLSFLIEGQHLLGKINLMQKYDECYSKHKFYAKHNAY